MAIRIPISFKLLIFFTSSFGILWTFLEPLGGLEFISNKIGSKELCYVILALISLFISFGLSARKENKNIVSNENLVIFKDTRLDFDHFQFMEDAIHSIQVAGISLPTYSSERAINLFTSLLRQGVTIDILLLNPFSKSFEIRPKGLYRVTKKPELACIDTIKTLKEFKNNMEVDLKDKFSVYITNILPGIGFIKKDDDIIWNPMLSNKTGAKSPYVIQSSNSSTARSIINHYQNLIQHHSIKLNPSASWNELVEYANKDNLAILDEKIEKLLYEAQA